MNLLFSYSKWRQPLTAANNHIRYFNFWDGQTADEIWFTIFLQSRGLLARHPNSSFVFFSTLGDIKILIIDNFIHHFAQHRRRIFFTGENIHYPIFKDYQHNLLDHSTIDLSLGFDYIDDSRYLRFPLWLLEMFPPQSTTEDIKQICDLLSHQQYHRGRKRFCALVSGNSIMFGTESMEMRKHMVESLNTIDTVDCAGKLLHNTDELKTKYNDNKAEFLKQYKFYICPENTSVEGYVTEKIFHAIGSGCIPIYWGSNNNPEPNVLNHDAILFWNPDSDNKVLLQQIEELQNNSNRYREFYEQPRLKKDAWQVVANYFNNLEQHLDDLFKS